MTFRPFRSLLAGICTAAMVAMLAVPAHAQLARPEDVVTLTPALPKTGFNPGETFQAALVLDIMDGYHLNPHLVKDPTLIPTDLEIPKDSPVAWPFVRYPEDQASAGADVPGYHDQQYSEQVMIRLVGRLPEDAEVGTLRVPMKVRYQTCTDAVCLMPYSKPVVMEIPVVAPGTEVKEINSEIFKKPGGGTE